MTSFFIKLFSAGLMFSPNISYDAPLNINVFPPPYNFQLNIESELTAQSIVIMDLESESIIYAKNADEKKSVASLAKLMTALIIFENHEPSETVKITSEMRNIEPVKMWLLENEEITVLNLARGLLIPSANDAALALAIYNAGTIELFANKMNTRAYQLGFENTQFKNPHGLDEDEHFSSAKDIALLCVYLLKNLNTNWQKIFLETISTKQIIVKSKDGKIEHELKNSNSLLGTELPIFGLKTGTTDNAGQCLATLFRKNKNYLIIVLGSSDRYGDTEKIIDAISREQ